MDKMAAKKNDFVELDFAAKIKDTGQVFDTTIEEEAKKAGLINENEDKKFKPFRLCIGQGMLVKGLDKELEGKETGKWHEIELHARDAFGLRDPKLIKIFSLNSFREKGINPEAGMMLTLDNMLVRIAAVSGGRVIVDFNSPLAGKAVVYRFRINKTIDDNQEKLAILTEFFLGRPEKIILQEKDKKAVIEFKFKFPGKIVEEFSKKIKDVLGIDVEIKEAKEIKDDKQAEKQEDKKEKQEIKKEGIEEKTEHKKD